MRYISNISDSKNKYGDTNEIFRLSLINNRLPLNFANLPLTVNISNSSGYILSMTPKKEFNNTVIQLNFNEEPLKRLTPDNYLLEVEVVMPDGTLALFPTNSGMPFTINNNLKGTTGELVPSVTFDTILDAVDEKVATYLATVAKGDKGDKGDTGVVDTAKDYTWTGNNTFNNAISGKFKNRPLTNGTDLYKLIEPGINYTSQSVQVSSFINKPEEVTSAFGIIGIDLSGYNDGIWSTTQLLLFEYVTGKIFTAIVSSNATKVPSVTKPWTKITTDDATVLHKTGTETVNGNKTFTGDESFTGSVSFDKPLDGSLSVRTFPFQSVSNISGKLIDYAGDWGVASGTQSGLPESGHAILTVSPYIDNPNSGFLTLKYTNGNMYFSEINGTLFTWRKSAVDLEVAHLNGEETINGPKTFTGDNTFNGNSKVNGQLLFNSYPVLNTGLDYKMVSMGLADTTNPSITPHQASHLSRSNANVSFNPMVYVPDKNSYSITMQDNSRVEQYINSIEATGRKVSMMKPHIGTPIQGDSFDRASYDPSDYTQFFKNWKVVLMNYAEISNRHNIELLCIGCEQYLQTRDQYAANWKDITDTLHTAYPNLKLTYAMNTTEILSPDTNYKFIQYLDYAGMNVYPKYTSDPDYTKQTPEQLAHAWYGTNHYTQINFADVVETIWQRYHKEIIITESGLRSVDDGLVWMLSNLKNPTYENFEVVRLAIEAIALIAKNEPRIKGVAWWVFSDWSFGIIPHSETDDSFTVAEKAINNWYGGQ